MRRRRHAVDHPVTAARWVALRSRVEAVDLAAWFLVLGAVFGACLVFLVPPAQGLDEPNHFFRAYTVTEGTIVAPIRSNRAGVDVPACVYGYVNDLYVDGLRPPSFHPGDYWRTPSCAGKPAQFVPIENTAVNSPVSYLPAELAILVLRGLGAPVPVVFFGGRLAGLAVFLALLFAAIRVAPRGKSVFFVVGLLPESLELASGYSADGMTIALALLAVALTLRLLDDEGTDRPWFAALAVTLVALAITKNTYFVLAPLVLLVPATRLKVSERLATLAKGAVLALAALATGAWYLVVRNVSLAAYPPSGTMIDSHKQIAYMLHHPIGYAHILVRSIFLTQAQDYYLPGFVQSTGFFRSPTRGSPLAPVGLVVFAVLVLAAAFHREAGVRRDGVTRLDWARAALPVVLAMVSVVVIFTVLFWQWTPVGATQVRGVQGRYFIPLVPLALLPLAILRVRPKPRPTPLWLVAGVALMLAYTLVKVGVLFY